MRLYRENNKTQQEHYFLLFVKEIDKYKQISVVSCK